MRAPETTRLDSVSMVLDNTGRLLRQIDAKYQSMCFMYNDLNHVTQKQARSRPSAGLMDYGARFYDPGLGRFIQPDSIVPNLFDPQSLNRYSYVLNNPVRYTDPTGHMAEIIGDKGAVAMA